MLSELGITVSAYTRSIGDVEIQSFDTAEIANNALNMPDAEAAEKASELLTKAMAEKNSVGGVVECVVHHMPAGVGDPVFEKLDANLAKALVSIGAVKGVEIGDGFSVCTATGLTNNDAFHVNADGSIVKLTNHAGGILGGISDGSDIVVRAGFKPTPSVAASQQTINKDGENYCHRNQRPPRPDHRCTRRCCRGMHDRSCPGGRTARRHERQTGQCKESLGSGREIKAGLLLSGFNTKMPAGYSSSCRHFCVIF